MTTEKQKPHRFSRKTKRTFLLGTAFLFLSCFLLTATWVHHFLQPGTTAEDQHIFVVREGETLKQVANGLEKIGLISNRTLFRLTGRFMGYDNQIKTGEYGFNGAMTPIEILERLKKGQIRTHNATIPEGFNLNQIAELLDRKGIVSQKAFMKLAKNSALTTHLGFSGGTLEGYLYPDTYRFQRDETPDKVIAIMVKRFRDVVSPLGPQIKNSEMTLKQVITLASIVEKETGCPEERPIIARVFLNRLKKNMRLQSDPTVIYGIKDFNGNLTKRDLKTKTPYNTYAIKGLPPGPIANPGLASIRAVLNPAESNFYYFVSKNNGTHYFSETLNEHNRAVRRFQKKMRPKNKG